MPQTLSVEDIVTSIGLGILGFLAAVIVGIAVERSMSRQCGDFTGNWYATPIGASDAPDGVFRLQSEGCRVTGELQSASQFVSLAGQADRTRMAPRMARVEGVRRNNETGQVDRMGIAMTLVASGKQILFEIMPEDGEQAPAAQYLLTELGAAGQTFAAQEADRVPN